MNIYTSYYALFNKFDDTKYIKIGVSRFHPNLGNKLLNLGELLAPSKELLYLIKDNIITQDEYKLRYIDELSKRIDQYKLYELFIKLTNKLNIDNIILFCYERSNKPCHRHYLAEWFNSIIKEIKIKEIII